MRRVAETSSGEAEVASEVLELLRKAPGRQMSGATLCAQLYKQSTCARQVLQNRGGLKSFVSIPLLEKHVQFFGDKVCDGRDYCVGKPSVACGDVSREDRAGRGQRDGISWMISV